VGKIRKYLLYAFFWIIPRRLNSHSGELPRRKHTTFRTRRKFEIKKEAFICRGQFIKSEKYEVVLKLKFS
jgi:hypothetical protein